MKNSVTNDSSTPVRLAWGFIVVLFIVLNLPFVMTFPPIDNVGDESWFMNSARNILESGRPLITVHAGTPFAREIQSTTRWIYQGILALALYVFGDSVLTGRMLSLLIGLYVVVITYLFARRLSNRGVALAACALLVSNTMFSWHCRETRPEMMLLAFVTTSVYLFTLGTRTEGAGRKRLLFFAGLVATLSVQAHQNGAIFAFSILFVYVFLNRRRIFSLSTLCLLGGLSLGFLVWVTCNFLPFSTASFQGLESSYLPPVLSKSVGDIFIDGILLFRTVLSPQSVDWLSHKYYSSLGVYLFYAGVVIVAVAFPLSQDRGRLLYLLAFMALPLFVSVFLTGAWAWNHSSIFLTMFAVTCAVAVHDVAQRWRGRTWRRAVFITAVSLMTMAGASDIMAGNVAMRKYDFDDLKEAVASSVPPDATVMGSSLYYLALSDRPGRFITYWFLKGGCGDFRFGLLQYEVDYFLLDDMFIHFSTEWCTSQYFSANVMPFLQTGASLQEVVNVDYPTEYARGRLLRRIYVYRLDKTQGSHQARRLGAD